MAVTEDQVAAQEESLRARLRLSGDTLDVDGTGSRAVRPPAPSRLLLEGRKVRTRRRLAAGSFAAAASVVVAGAGAGVAGGAFTLPWLRADGSSAPATPSASRGTAVGDVVDAIDTAFGSYTRSEGGVWWYRSGPNVAGRYPQDSDVEADQRTFRRQYGLDRVVRAALAEAPDQRQGKVEVTLARTDPGGVEDSAPYSLGTLTLGADGRGTWLRVRPRAEDGWLLFAVLPENAGAAQVRVAGTEVELPVNDVRADDTRCLGPIETRPDGGRSCRGRPMVHLRIATTDPEPPIDAINYVDQDGRYVVIGAEDHVD
jgi:hypothetical protein